jgi:hypothetical protein
MDYGGARLKGKKLQEKAMFWLIHRRKSGKISMVRFHKVVLVSGGCHEKRDSDHASHNSLF